MKIIICGANGQVGNEFKKIVYKKSYEVLFFGKSELDVCNPKAINNCFSKYKPNFVINCSGFTAVDDAETNIRASTKLNADAPLYIARECLKVGAAMIHISTDYVFSGDTKFPYKEDDIPDPKSIYGLSKLKGEKNIQENLKEHIILRTSWVFGANGNNFVKTILALGKKNKTLNIISNQWGSPTSAKAIALCCIQICKEVSKNKNFSKWGVFHYTGVPYINWYGFSEIIFKYAKKIDLLDEYPQINAVNSEYFNYPASRPLNSMLDCKKIHKTFGIKSNNWKKDLRDFLKSVNKI